MAMNAIRRWAGWVWMAMSPLVVYLILSTAAEEVRKHPVTDTWIQWGVFVLVFLPIAAGLFLFGWYAWKGEYDHLPESSSELGDDR